MGRLTTDKALAVILAILATGIIFIAIIESAILLPRIDALEQNVTRLCNISNIHNDTETYRLEQANQVLKGRNGPGDVELRTLNKSTLNDYKDAAKIIERICDT